MAVTRTSFIKKNQKESLIRRQVGLLLQQAALDYPQLQEFAVTRVVLSNNKSTAAIFLYSTNGSEAFKQNLPFLKLFGPSLRKALAQTLVSKYVPEVRFFYDAAQEKQQALERLLDQIKQEPHES